MDILTLDKLIIFLIVFMPGFISFLVYRLLYPSERMDISKSIFEIVGYSVFNYAAFLILLYPIFEYDVPDKYPKIYFMILSIVMFFGPLAWPFLWRWVSGLSIIKDRIVHPIKKPWDYVFGQRENYWVIVHLKDGSSIAGKYGDNSFTSSYPAKEQIYLEQVWTLDEHGRFADPMPHSAGIIVLGDEILAVELTKFEDEGTNNAGQEETVN